MKKYSDAMAFLRALGIDDLHSFMSRKRVQKIIYILKQFGASLKFGYGWYIHGPYSPELTRTLLNQTNTSMEPIRELTITELQIINNMRNFLGEDLFSVDSLELIVSLIYLIKHAPKEGYDTKLKIIEYLKNKKPQFSSKEIEAAWSKIEKSERWERYFQKLKD